MASILITGSNRGLGLEWARQYAELGWRVFATCRHPSEAKALHALAESHDNLTIHRLDVTRTDEAHAAALELQDEALDILLSNAGVYLEHGDVDLPTVRYDEWQRTLDINTLGVMRLVEAFTPHLARGARPLLAAISSHMGSIADIEVPGSVYYRSSKAALNATLRGLVPALRPRGIGVLILHPGGVRTRMGPPGGLTPRESVAGMRRLLERFTPADSGRFLRYDGVELPW